MREGEPAPHVVAVVPLRDGVSGKSRLATELDPARRHRLIQVLAEHVLGVLVAAPSVNRIAVVTADPSFARRVASAHVTLPSTGQRGRVPDVVPQPADNPGLNAALDIARDRVRLEDPRSRLLIVHADLPALTVADVEAILAPNADVVIACDRDASGTNALVVDAAAGFTFRFGPGSLAAHSDEAAALRLTVALVDRPGSRVDLDTVADWPHLPPGTRDEVERRLREP